MSNQTDTAGRTVLRTPSDREIVSERVFDAPRERVFALYTDPQQIPRWWGPRRMTTTVEEMDLPAVLARAPELCLIDELAHTNAPGTEHAKRYEDVIELLDAKIDVLSTVNVQHIESVAPT